MKTTCSHPGCDELRWKASGYCLAHKLESSRKSYQKRFGKRKNNIVHQMYTEEQLTEIWRNAGKGAFDRDEVQKMAEDLMTLTITDAQPESRP